MTYNNSLDNLIFISNNRDIIKLSEFEINLLNDRLQAYKDLNGRIRISDKQAKILQKIVNRIKLKNAKLFSKDDYKR